MLWAARFASLRSWGSFGAETCVDVEPWAWAWADKVEDSLKRERALRRLSVRVGMYSLDLISGLQDQRVEDVDIKAEVLVVLFVRELEEARVDAFDGDVDVVDVMTTSIEGHVLINQDWSSSPRSS